MDAASADYRSVVVVKGLLMTSGSRKRIAAQEICSAYIRSKFDGLPIRDNCLRVLSLLVMPITVDSVDVWAEDGNWTLTIELSKAVNVLKQGILMNV